VKIWVGTKWSRLVYVMFSDEVVDSFSLASLNEDSTVKKYQFTFIVVKSNSKIGYNDVMFPRLYVWVRTLVSKFSYCICQQINTALAE
jgi:hypothetical protein